MTSNRFLSSAKPLVFATGAALLLSGCMSFGGNSGVRPLTPVPTTSVSSAALPAPISIQAETDQTLADAALGPEAAVTSEALPNETAGLPSSTTGGAEVSEDDLVGVWSASTPSATCSINLSLTTWQGGFRASTRNCGDIQMAGLTAWSVEGQQVMLKGAEGATLARLFRTGPTRYAGQLETGGAVTVFR